MWFTADTHFGHANIIGHCNRPWADVEAMNEALIANWNGRVGKRDIVWHLGDFSFRGGDPRAYFSRLNGLIHFIIGNHDIRRKLEGCTMKIWDAHEVRYMGRHIWLSHYAHRVWPKSFHGSLHLYGHSHGTLPGHGRSMDVGVDAVGGYAPIHIAQIIERIGDNHDLLHRA